jgi:nucleoside-diphosphate-sugar epimerase
MKVFITGGTGFIGSHYLAHMSSLRHEITALRRSGSVPCVDIPRQPIWLEKPMDSIDESDLEGHDVLVHLASVGVSPQKATWQEMIYWNVGVLMRLLEAGMRAGVRRFVLAGSSAEYGASAARYEFLPVDAPLQPTSPYAASKAAGCVLASTFAINSQVELIYLRIFSTYGDGQYEENFWPALKAAAISGKDFSMTLGEQVRDYIPVEEVAKTIHIATVREDIRPGIPKIINVATGNPVTMREFAERYWRQWGAKGELLIGKLLYRPNEPMRLVPEVESRTSRTCLSGCAE